MSRTSIFLALAALAAWPSVASANLTATVGAFGAQHTVTTATPNLVTQPVGGVDCNTEIPITFSGLTSTGVPTTRYIQVWAAAAASANCGVMTARSMAGIAPCTMVPISPTDATSYQTGVISFEMRITPLQLFGTCESGQRSFFFFDVASTQADVSTMFTATAGPNQYWELDIAIDATPPPMPTLAGPAAGDSSIGISWTATDVGLAPAVTVYFDPNGCNGEAGTSTLIGGSAAPAGGIIYGPTAASSTASIPIANFPGWTASMYGQTGAIAITVTDTAGNVSVLSTPICVSHVVVTGFWEQYCAEHGMTVAQCTNNYHGCAVGPPGRRTDLGAVAGLMLVLGVFVARRRRAR